MERSVLEETIYNRYIVQQEEREPIWLVWSWSCRL